jgi:hypothetical protein
MASCFLVLWCLLTCDNLLLGFNLVAKVPRGLLHQAPAVSGWSGQIPGSSASGPAGATSQRLFADALRSMELCSCSWEA